MTTPEMNAAQSDLIATAAAHVRAGGLIILPTDTVYGIGTRADSPEAVACLLAAKGRGRQMPPPVLVSDTAQLSRLVAQIPDAAARLMRDMWPGALTIILDAAPDLGWDLGETGGTIAVRMPDHPIALELVRQAGPMAVTSANHTGEPPATDAHSSQAAFPGRVIAMGQHSSEGDGLPYPPTAGGDSENEGACGVPQRTSADILLLDGGSTPGPVPSTIISFAGPYARAPRIIRDGVITREDLAASCGIACEEFSA